MIDVQTTVPQPADANLSGLAGGPPPPAHPFHRWVRRNPDLIICALVPPGALSLTFALIGISAPVGVVVGSIALFIASYGITSYVRVGALITKDRLARVAVYLGAAVSLAALYSILQRVIVEGLPVLMARFPHFLTADLAQAGPTAPVTKAGVGNAIVGTVEEVGIATLITVPLSLLTALFLDEASRSGPERSARVLRAVANLTRMVIDAMNGIPSIIAALFMYLVWVEPHGVHGFSGAAAGAAITIMMYPTVTRSAEEALRIVHGSLREASLALGAPQWKTVLKVTLPTARSGLIGGAILGIARGVGETAPTLFTAHGNPLFNDNPFHGAQGNLALEIYELAFSPATNAVREAWGLSLVLMLFVGLLFFVARLLGTRRRRRWIPRRRPLEDRTNSIAGGN